MADALFEQLIAEGYVKENSVNYDAEKHWYAYQCEGVGGFSDVTCYLDIAVKDLIKYLLVLQQLHPHSPMSTMEIQLKSLALTIPFSML